MKSVRVALITGVLLVSSVFPASAGTFASGAAGATAYTEQASPVVIAPDATLSQDSPAQNYAGGKLTVAIGSAASDEQLSLTRVQSADTALGAISIVGDFVYRGTGSGTEVIGAVDGIKNGVNGQDLVINFSQGFTNGNFENSSASQSGNVVSLSGWTVYLDRITMSDTGYTGTTVAGFPTPTDATYPRVPATKDRVGANNSYTYNNTYTGRSGSGKALQLSTDGGCDAGYCVIRGPYVVSNGAVALAANDSVSFYWTALGASDAYDVYGYLLNTVDGSTIQLINATGADGNATQAWTQVTKTITAQQAGTYKFVFIAGTWDASGGQAEGASLVIDDVAVTAAAQLSVSPADIQALARLVTYAQTGDDPATSRTVTFTTDRAGTTESFTQNIAVTAVDDSARVADVNLAYLTSNLSTDTGTLTITDPDTAGSWAYSIQGSTSIANGRAYKAGSYGELYLDVATGAYEYVPLDVMIIGDLSGRVGIDTFTVTAQKGASGIGTATFTVRISETPTVSSISPTSGPIAGGTVVTITGTNLGGLTGVQFGGTAGTSLTIVSATEAQITTPAKPLGAVNVVFSSPAGTITTLTGGYTYATLVAPGAPRNVVVTRYETSLAVAYAAPNSGGAVASYEIEYTPTGGSPTTVQCSTALTCTITGLTADTEYSVVVKAKNAAGSGSASAVTTRTLASEPILPNAQTPPAGPAIQGPVSRGSTGGSLVTTSGGATQTNSLNVVVAPINQSTGLQMSATVPSNDGTTDTVVADLEARTPSGEPIPLAADGSFRVQRGLEAEVAGAGFKSGTTAQVWLFSTPVLLGEFTVDGNGAFVGTVPVPVTLGDGVHTLQLTGVTNANDVLSMAVGISVFSPPAPTPLLPLGSPVIKGNAVVGQTITCTSPAFDLPVESYSLYFRVDGKTSAPVTGNIAPVPALTITNEMVGKSIECVVFARSANATSTIAATTAAVRASAPVPGTPPTQPSLSKASVAFSSASARISPSARATVARLNLTGVKSIRVTGYARKGSSARERKVLPKARAEAVVALLRLRGFTGIITTATAVGSTGTARDRRVDIQLTR